MVFSLKDDRVKHPSRAGCMADMQEATRGAQERGSRWEREGCQQRFGYTKGDLLDEKARGVQHKVKENYSGRKVLDTDRARTRKRYYLVLQGCLIVGGPLIMRKEEPKVKRKGNRRKHMDRPHNRGYSLGVRNRKKN